MSALSQLVKSNVTDDW